MVEVTADEEVLDMESHAVAGPSASGDPEHQPSEGKRLDRILVAIDGSPRSEHVIELAVELASEYQSELLFVHVIPIVDGATSAEVGDVGDAVPQTPTEHDQTPLKEAAAFARRRGVAARSTLLVGSAAAAIVAYAESHDVNMIVVGARRDGDMACALLGRVSLAVLRTSGRPLVIVDGDSITYCGNGSCRDVRMYGHSATNDASSPARCQVPNAGGGAREALTMVTRRGLSRAPSRSRTGIEWSHGRVSSGVPDAAFHSPKKGPGIDRRPASGNVSAVAGTIPSLLALLSGAIRLETIVFVAEDAWAITATIPYGGVILLAEFTTRHSASEWFAIANTLVRS